MTESQRPSGYAGEIAGIAALFQKLGGSIYGLALAESAWLGLLILLKELGAGGSVTVPVPLAGRATLTTVAWVGAFVVLCGWLATAGGPRARSVARAAWHLLTVAGKVLICLICLLGNVVLWPVLSLIERLWVRRQLPRYEEQLRRSRLPTLLDQDRKANPRVDPDAAVETDEDRTLRVWAEFQARQAEELGRDWLADGYLAVSPVTRWPAGKVVDWAFYRPEGSTGVRLGVAPVRPFALLDDRASGPIDVADVFSRSLLRLHADAPSVSALTDLNIVKLGTPWHGLELLAKTLRGRDASFKGRFLDPERALVTLSFRPVSTTTPATSDIRDFDSSRHDAFFPWPYRPPTLWPLTVDLSDADEVDVAILLSALHLPDSGRANSVRWDEIAAELARRVARTSTDRVAQRFRPAGQAAVAVSTWVGYLLGLEEYNDGDLGGPFWRRDDRVTVQDLLLPAIDRCVESGVDPVANGYRRAALLFLLRRPDDEVLEALAVAARADTTIYDGGFAAVSRLEFELTMNAKGVGVHQTLALARGVVFAASATRMGNAGQVRDLIRANSSLAVYARDSRALPIIERLARAED